MKIFIGNLGSEITNHDIITLFAEHGEVVEGCVAKDDDGNSRGFGYVLMRHTKQAEAAINALNKKRFKEQFISVSEAIHSERYHNRVAQPKLQCCSN
jgi:RNA recognition motif-containing protein